MLAGSLFVARNRRFPPFTVIRAAALLSAGGIALMPFLPSFWALLVPLWLCSLQDGANHDRPFKGRFDWPYKGLVLVCPLKQACPDFCHCS